MSPDPIAQSSNCKLDKELLFESQWDRFVGKRLYKPSGLSPIPRTHVKVERENGLHRVVLWPGHVHWGMHPLPIIIIRMSAIKLISFSQHRRLYPLPSCPGRVGAWVCPHGLLWNSVGCQQRWHSGDQETDVGAFIPMGSAASCCSIPTSALWKVLSHGCAYHLLLCSPHPPLAQQAQTC